MLYNIANIVIMPSGRYGGISVYYVKTPEKEVWF